VPFALENVVRAHGTVYFFRGQSKATWGLVPTLPRVLPEGVTAQQALDIEEAALQQFRSTAHLHLAFASLPADLPGPALPEWWALMQHHHAPTRLLDWTESPYVAAYFAVEKDWEDDGAVFMIHGHHAQASFHTRFGSGTSIKNEQLRDSGAPSAVLLWCPRKRSDRLVAQQGRFSLSVGILGSHEELIGGECANAEAREPGRTFHKKLVIPKKLKPEFLSRLRLMNIAAHSLFPGIDGLGRSVAEMARLAGA